MFQSGKYYPSTLWVWLGLLFIFLSACTTAAPTPTLIPPPTATATATMTSTPSPTATATSTPLPTATFTPTFTPTPPPAEFNNLVLALDYDLANKQILSPRTYFPAGVAYMAFAFDYSVPALTTLTWQIVNENEEVVDSGTVKVNAGKGQRGAVIRLSDALDNGEYQFILNLDDEPLLSTSFEIFWNPTLWPVVLSEEISQTGEPEDGGDTFEVGTEFLFAYYPTINFAVGDEILAEWFLEGEKIGEHQYVWDNAEWSTGFHGNKIENPEDDSEPLPAGSYHIIVYVNGAPKQCKAFQVTDEADPTPPAGCDQFQEEVAVSVGEEPSDNGTWGRYQERTLAELNELTAELTSDLEDGSIYFEASPDYQYPSLITITFGGEFRDITPATAGLIQMWLMTFAPQLTPEQAGEIFAQEVLFLDGDQEYWFPVQSTLTPFMEDELTAGDEVLLYVVWMGAIKQEGEVQNLYLVNAYE